MYDKKTTIELISSISMAVVNCLVSRENGIGSNQSPDSITAINNLYSMRKAIITENLDLCVRDKNITLVDDSFLRAFSYDDILNKDFGSIPNDIANIVESEILNVRDVIIPEANELASRVDAVTNSYTAKSTYESLFNNVVFYSGNTLSSLLAGSDLADVPPEAVDISGLATISIPSISDSEDSLISIDFIKEKIKVNNPIVDAAIDSFLAGKSDEYWINLYNKTFTSYTGDSMFINDLCLDSTRYATEILFIYLVSRAIVNNKIEFIVNTSKNEYVNTVETLHSYFKHILNRMLKYVSTTPDKVYDYHEYSDGSNVLIIRKANMSDLLDVDVISGAALSGISKKEEIISNIDKCRDVYINAIELKTIDRRNRMLDALRDLYMKTTLHYFGIEYTSEDVKYNISNQEMSFEGARMTVSDLVYGMSIDLMLKPQDAFVKILLDLKYNTGNSKFIIDRMSFYLSTLEKTEDRFSSVSEYVALELVTKYFLNTHVINIPDTTGNESGAVANDV